MVGYKRPRDNPGKVSPVKTNQKRQRVEEKIDIKTPTQGQKQCGFVVVEPENYDRLKREYEEAQQKNEELLNQMVILKLNNKIDIGRAPT